MAEGRPRRLVARRRRLVGRGRLGRGLNLGRGLVRGGHRRLVGRGLRDHLLAADHVDQQRQGRGAEDGRVQDARHGLSSFGVWSVTGLGLDRSFWL